MRRFCLQILSIYMVVDGGGREALCDLSMLTQVAIDESAPHLIKASIIYSYLATQRILRNSEN